MTRLVHLDLNGTLTDVDTSKSAQNSVELNRCATLAKYLEGEVINGQFIPTADVDDHESKQTISYKNYMINYLKLDKKEREVQTRKILDVFPSLKEKYQTLTKAAGNSFLLPSAKTLLLYLKELHDDGYSVVACIRTFGMDYKLLQASVTDLKIELVVIDPNKLSTISNFVQFLKDQSFSTTFRLYFIQDDYNRWKDGNYTGQSGKVFPLIDGAFNIFFDDNAEDDIINPRRENGEWVSPLDLSKWGKIVNVHTFDNVVNHDYFVQFLK